MLAWHVFYKNAKIQFRYVQPLMIHSMTIVSVCILYIYIIKEGVACHRPYIGTPYIHLQTNEFLVPFTACARISNTSIIQCL